MSLRRALFRKQPRRPARRQRGGEVEAQRRAGALRGQRLALDQGGGDAAGLALARAEKAGDLAPRQLTAEQDRFQDDAGFGEKRVGNDLLAAAVVGIFGPEQRLGQLVAEAAMDFENSFARRGAPVEAAFVDPPLDGDMGLGLELEIALARIGAIVVAESALDVDRMRLPPDAAIAPPSTKIEGA